MQSYSHITAELITDQTRVVTNGKNILKHLHTPLNVLIYCMSVLLWMISAVSQLSDVLMMCYDVIAMPCI